MLRRACLKVNHSFSNIRKLVLSLSMSKLALTFTAQLLKKFCSTNSLLLWQAGSSYFVLSGNLILFFPLACIGAKNVLIALCHAGFVHWTPQSRPGNQVHPQEELPLHSTRKHCHLLMAGLMHWGVIKKHVKNAAGSHLKQFNWCREIQLKLFIQKSCQETKHWAVCTISKYLFTAPADSSCRILGSFCCHFLLLLGNQ